MGSLKLNHTVQYKPTERRTQGEVRTSISSAARLFLYRDVLDRTVGDLDGLGLQGLLDHPPHVWF